MAVDDSHMLDLIVPFAFCREIFGIENKHHFKVVSVVYALRLVLSTLCCTCWLSAFVMGIFSKYLDNELNNRICEIMIFEITFACFIF